MISTLGLCDCFCRVLNTLKQDPFIVGTNGCIQVHPLIELWTESVLGVWEESTKSVIRESFTNATRFVNGFFSWCLAFFVDREHYKSFRSSWTRTQAWQSWWQEDRQSTLNAFIATHSATPKQQRRPGALFLVQSMATTARVLSRASSLHHSFRKATSCQG